MENINTQPANQPAEAGMSLIEVMISMIVLGIVLVGLGQALTFGIKANTQNKMRLSSLNACKYLTENLKTQLSQTQGIFDGTAPSDVTYYIDATGNKTYSSGGLTPVEGFTSASAYRAHVVITNTGLTKTIGGVTSVLVKALDVSVVDVQNAGNTGREVRMRVEIIRPSA